MSKIETDCPYCKKQTVVEKNHFGVGDHVHGLQKVQCSHCSKSWETDLDFTGSLAKSAPVPSSELAKLRVQVRGQLDELMKQVNTLLTHRTAPAKAARFDTNGRKVEKSDEVNREFLNKALENGKRIGSEVSTARRFQTVETIGVGVRTAPGGRFAPDGFEKNDVAREELAKALANGKPVGFIPHRN